MELDALGPGVLGDVGEGLLRHAVERQTGLGCQRVFFTGNREPARDPPVVLELGGKLREPFGPGKLVVAEHPDGATGLLQTGPAKVVRPVDDLGKPGVARMLHG